MIRPLEKLFADTAQEMAIRRSLRAKQLFTHRIHGNGIQRVYRFDNGFGASVVRHPFSYGHQEGKWELALLQFFGTGEEDWFLVYDRYDFNDVLGYLSDSEVEDTLYRIQSFPKTHRVRRPRNFQQKLRELRKQQQQQQ